MKHKQFLKRFSVSRQLGLILLVAIALTPLACGGSSSNSSNSSPQTIRSTTQQYVEQFYPLWLSYNQSVYTHAAGTGPLGGPNKISPIYQIVVAINVDTLYASAFLNLSQPLVLTIPSTPVHYSILVLDALGNILTTTLPTLTPGTFGLTGPGFTGTLPAGITPVPIPINFVNLIVRADNYSPTGVNQQMEAAEFRQDILLQTLSGYEANPGGGATNIIREALFAAPFKVTSDTLVTKNSIKYLQQLQVAVASSNTPPLNADQQALVTKFNSLFGSGNFKAGSSTANAFIGGAQAGYNAIIADYLNHTGSTNWINFTNIGEWGDNFLDRSAIAEYIQYGNNFSEAAYFQTFKDGSGGALNGSTSNYVLKFPKGQIPQASRFWSVTAYTPDSIELIDNPINKYAVASYTPGLVTNPDGSISISMAVNQPNGVPTANWLPVANGPFNIMLRVYGPEGSVADKTYVPPAVAKAS